MHFVAKKEDTSERELKVNMAQSCTTLCDSMDYIVHGILQARTLEWVAFAFSRGSSQPRSAALQVDSLPAEPQGKPRYFRTASFLKKLTRKHNDNDDEQKLLYFLGK